MTPGQGIRGNQPYAAQILGGHSRGNRPEGKHLDVHAAGHVEEAEMRATEGAQIDRQRQRWRDQYLSRGLVWAFNVHTIE